MRPESARLGAGDDFHQRRFAGAVVADERGHFALADFQIHRPQRLDRAECFADAVEAQARLRG